MKKKISASAPMANCGEEPRMKHKNAKRKKKSLQNRPLNNRQNIKSALTCIFLPLLQYYQVVH